MRSRLFVSTWFLRNFTRFHRPESDGVVRALLDSRADFARLQPTPSHRAKAHQEHQLDVDDVLVRAELPSRITNDAEAQHALRENQWRGLWACSPTELLSLSSREESTGEEETHGGQEQLRLRLRRLPKHALATDAPPARHLVYANDLGEFFFVVPRVYEPAWKLEGCSHCCVAELSDAALLPPLDSTIGDGDNDNNNRYEFARGLLALATHPERLCPFHFHYLLTGDRLSYAEAVVLDNAALREDRMWDWTLGRARAAAAWFEDFRR